MTSIHVISSLKDGGAQKALLKLATSLPDEKFLIIPISLGGRYTAELTGLENVFITHLFSGELIRNITKIRKNKKKVSVVGWMYHGFVAAVFLWLFIPNGQLVLNVRQALYSYRDFKNGTKIVIFVNLILCWILRPKIVYVANEAKRTHNKKGFPTAKDLVIQNGFPIVSRKKYNSLDSSDKIIFLTAARFTPQKNIPFLLSGFSSVLKKDKNVKLLMYGVGMDLKNNELQAIIKKYGIKDYVELRGVEKDISKIFNEGHFYLQTSKMEGFSNSLCEAMSFGLVPICSEVGDNKEILNGNGFSFSRCNMPDFELAISNAIDLYRNELSNFVGLTLLCRSRISSEYSVVSFAERWKSQVLNSENS